MARKSKVLQKEPLANAGRTAKMGGELHSCAAPEFIGQVPASSLGPNRGCIARTWLDKIPTMIFPEQIHTGEDP